MLELLFKGAMVIAIKVVEIAIEQVITSCIQQFVRY
jgi:hypothetical protein